MFIGARTVARQAFQSVTPINILKTAHMSSLPSVGAIEARGGAGGVIAISNATLLVSSIPLALVAILSWKMQLGVSSSLLTGAFRTFIQLSILAAILQPIFTASNIFLVVAYCFFMTTLAAQASCSRIKYQFKGQFLGVLGCLLTSVATVASFAFVGLIRPYPLYNPQYVIPIVGMLLGNSMNGISLTLNHLTSSIVEQQREINLYLSFGATAKEAISRILREAVRSGTTPLLNNLAVIGLVSIPGMMTGQILGGSSVIDAARYQCLIMYLITIATFCAILMETLLVLQIGFDKSHMLRPDRFTKELKKSKNVLKWLFGLMKRKSNESKSKKSSQNENTPLIQTSSAIEDPITNNVEVQPLLYLNESEGDTNMLEIRNLCKSTDGWDKKEKDTLVGHEENMDSRNLFEHFSFNVKSNGMSSVTGPSGSGKSQLLQCIASLTPIQEGEVLLNGKRWDIESRVEWRRKVRYVTQFKVDIPGKPIDFIKRITSFKSWIKDPSAPKLEDVVETTQTLISKWGLSVDCLDKDWTILSGGESQRVILAIAFASKPEVMMLDESTSALDQKSKAAVEASIKEYTQKFGWKVLLVSHDGEQFERMKDLIV